MKRFESIYDSDKFGKTELRKIKGGYKLTCTGTSLPIVTPHGKYVQHNDDTDSDNGG